MVLAAAPLTTSLVARQDPPAPAAQGSTPLPRGKKLILTDGSYQLIREYKRNGDQVKYYSVERGEWEEIPASMVDWKATEAAEANEQKEDAALVAKIHKQEEAKRMDNVTDIDASLLVGNGAFLPDGEGMFVVEGKSVRPMEQAGSSLKKDKLRTLGQIISPVPITPGKSNVVLPNAHAVLRLTTRTPEFYLRERPPDPDARGRIEQSSAAAESGPDVELIRAKVGHNSRNLESITTLVGEAVSSKRDSLSIQRWEVAPRVYRFTLSQPLEPGEYVLAEVLEDGLNLFVWDFGVDGESGKPSNGKPATK